ncbi:MAG TPA: hypothetical protein VNW72_04215 [Chthoniobacterales bacterium]|jgi:hypothetical protein|nr:hypothetical protein [Chthoniobacterales bacterium]
MTITIPHPQYLIYQLSDNLRADTPSPGVRTPPATESDREELLLSKLGPRGWGRLYHFRYFYSAGWGDGSGKPMSPRALESFYRFLESAQFPKDSTPSVFLTDEGSVELCWEDQKGKSVEVEFRPTDIEFYIESRGTEGSVPSADAKTLAKKLAA